MNLSHMLLVFAATLAAAQDPEVRFATTGHTDYGEWSAKAAFSPSVWKPGDGLTATAALTITEGHLAKLAGAKLRADAFCVLMTAERTFDSDGILRLPSDERMSTLVTPTGLPIEGGVQGAVTNRFGYAFRTPVDQFVTVAPAGPAPTADGSRNVVFELRQQLPRDLPPGIYRLRLDFGIVVNKRYYSLNGQSFAVRPFFNGQPTESHMYSPPVPASGKQVSGLEVDASAIRPRVPWVLLNGYNSNGYRGVVADEERAHFAISGRNLIQDDVILPLLNPDTKKLAAYSLEPQFLTDTIEARNNIPWNYKAGELSVQVTGPDGKTVNLGTWPFVGNSGQWPTTRKSAITGWKPSGYGYYTVKATGWTADIWGNRYEGGGTYHFWIANRMTMATATFQGMSYQVGNRYGRDIGFAPAVPADVEIEAVLYPDSEPGQARRVISKGKATPGGTFGAAQGLTPLTFDVPGEYYGHVLARYTDEQGNLWVCSMRHAGVVYPPDTAIVARGKKLTAAGGKIVERGETHFEGYVDDQGENHLAHINYPWNQGDVLLIASDGQGANKIEPVLTYEEKENPQPYDTRLQSIGISNVRMSTSNGYSPHLFPEYITDRMYYYAGAPRPGFMSRFIVAENGTRAPYWPTSPNSFGGQINASANGDLPGDIYRLIGGVVVRKKDQKPQYAGYLASAFLLPKDSGNNRVIAPGSENVLGPTGEKARFFLVGTRPGMVYEAGSTFAPAVQIDPMVPANVSFTLDYPDGRRVTATGAGDAAGSFAGKDRWPLDVPGVYRYHLDAEWQGHQGIMPGLPPDGGELYVIDKRPDGEPGLRLELPAESSFDPLFGTTISGISTAKEVYYAAVIPGAVIDQGYVPVQFGRFQYSFNPKLVNQKTQTYDIANRVTHAPQIGDVVHLTFFAKQIARDGTPYYCHTRVIFRGTKIIWAK